MVERELRAVMTMIKWQQMIIRLTCCAKAFATKAVRDQKAVLKSLDSTTEMRTLLFSMILYLTGIAVVLFFRPSLMFHRDGRWKEFGIGDLDGGTVFPFWLFCVVWAVVSYIITYLITGSPMVNNVSANVAANSVALAPLAPLRNSFMESGPGPESESGPEPPMKSGYYRLNTAGSKKGVPRYVYVGPDEPEDA